MSIKLTYRAETSLRIEIKGLTPDWAWDKSLAVLDVFVGDLVAEGRAKYTFAADEEPRPANLAYGCSSACFSRSRTSSMEFSKAAIRPAGSTKYIV